MSTMPVLVWIVSVLVLVGWVPAVVFALQIFSAGPQELRMGDPADAVEPEFTGDLVVLVPAHDEALVIGATLLRLRQQVRAQDRILLVADNCTDDTAEIARAAGAEVVIRHDPTRRGKGHALARGVEHLALGRAPSVVIIVDADCLVAPGTLARLGRQVCDTGRPAQAVYLMDAATGVGRRQNVSLFAWRVKNWLRPRGSRRLGWPCQLTGSGMAFPWALLRVAHLDHAGIVEDMQLGLDLAMKGAAPELCAGALVTSTLARSAVAESTQRKRWEQGHLIQILTTAPTLAASAFKARDIRQLQLLLDLSVPPLSLLVWISTLTTIGLSTITIFDRGYALPALLAAGALAMLCLAVHRAWSCCGSDLIRGRDLFMLVRYAVLKLPLYLAMIVQRRAPWNKTHRDG